MRTFFSSPPIAGGITELCRREVIFFWSSPILGVRERIHKLYKGTDEQKVWETLNYRASTQPETFLVKFIGSHFNVGYIGILQAIAYCIMKKDEHAIRNLSYKILRLPIYFASEYRKLLLSIVS